MFSPSTIHDWMSGEQQGVIAGLFRSVSSVIEQPFAWYAKRRNQAYDFGRAEIVHVATPVISVGNLTTGGTGKTPLVEWLARLLQSQGQSVVLLSRGYGARAGHVNDEALELAAKLPGVPHLQNRDRVRIAQQAVQEYPDSVLVLDDGFQHRRLHRDLDIVLLDATNPFGYEHVLPRGLLREPIAGLKRAQVVVLTRADFVSEQDRNQLQARVQAIAPQAVWCETIHAPSKLMNQAGECLSLESLRGRRVAAFCGIGNPAAFRRTLETCGCEIVFWRAFADHYAYHMQEVQQFANSAKQQEAELLICTAKDAVKIDTTEIGGLSLYALQVEMQFLSGQEKINRKVQDTLLL